MRDGTFRAVKVITVTAIVMTVATAVLGVKLRAANRKLDDLQGRVVEAGYGEWQAAGEAENILVVK
jgi:signal transduction histidine kinase